jgi:hypothetical protein
MNFGKKLMKKYHLLHIQFILLFVLGCQDPKSSKTSSSSNDSSSQTVSGDYCTQNPEAYGCPEYCAQNPTVCSASGSDSSSGDSSSSSESGSSSQYIPKDNNWQALYGSSTHDPVEFECTAPTGSGYDLRKGTITLGGDNTWYIPGGDTTYKSRTGDELSSPSDLSAFSTNISSFLISASEAKQFYDTDSKLKVRFKIRPQPVPTKGEAWCYNRQTGLSQDTWGYTLLKFSVSLVGLNADGSLKKSGNYPVFESTKSVTANVGSCTEAIDFSGDNQRNPYGVVLVIHDVQSDQSCWYNTGSSKCTGYKTLRRASCWQMDIEASVDGTKDI